MRFSIPSFLLLAALMVGMQSMAQSSKPFDGTWKADLSKIKFPEKPVVLALKDGRYQCSTCIPKIDVAADGQDHKISGSPYSDTMRVTVVDPHTVEVISKKNGQTVATEHDVVSEDGNRLTEEYTGRLEANSPEMTSKLVSVRVAKGQPGSHAISGSWREEKATEASATMVTQTFKSLDNGLEMSQPNGASYSAKFDGKDYPYKGDPGTTSVSLRRVSSHHIEETDKRNGKVIGVADMTVSPDGQRMTTVFHDKLQGTTFTFVMDKQPD